MNTIEELEKTITPLYEVGGCVRDTLLGVAPKDTDYTTPLTPDEVEEKIREAGRRPFVTGKRFGTVGLTIDGKLVEITTFRSERYEPGSRKPLVEFAKSIEQDLSRRDFTINAIARRGNRLIDPFRGQDDLKAGIIRAVGNPTERFKDDPLRLLRACRFAAQLGFSIEEATKRSIAKNAHQILYVSKERWVQELDRLLTSERPAQGLRVAAETGVLRFILPWIALQVDFDQKSPYHSKTLFEHTLAVVEGVENDIYLRWAALLHDVGKPFIQTFKEDGQANYIHHELVGAELVEGIGKYLRWSRERLTRVQELVATHAGETSPLRAADKLAH